MTYLGTNALLLEKDGFTLLVDPHFTRPSIRTLMGRISPSREITASIFNEFSVHQIEAVLLTHTHYDHALDTAEVIRLAGGVLVGSESAANLARGAGLFPNQFQLVIPGEDLQVGPWRIRYFPSRHIPFLNLPFLRLPVERRIRHPIVPPVWFWEYRCGKPFAIQIDNLLVFGSAGYQSGAYQNLRINSVILSVGGLETKTKRYLEELYWEVVVKTGASSVYISHWDNFFRGLGKNLIPLGFAKQTIRRVRQLGLRFGQEVRVLRFGCKVEI